MEENIVWENDWAKFMAMDENGKWFEYELKPIQKDMFWAVPHFGGGCGKKTIPKLIVDWKESLIKKERNTEMKVKTIQLYETSDNSVFRDLKEAEEHQKKVDLDELLFKNGYSKEDAMTFSNFIIENKEKLKEILFN